MEQHKTQDRKQNFMENFFKTKNDHKNDVFSALKKQINAVKDETDIGYKNLTKLNGGP